MANVRSVWLCTAKLNINFKMQHIRGKENHYADLLSCWEVYKHSNDQQTAQLMSIVKCQWHLVECSMFNA